jgi:hypothetical protein
MSDQHSQQVVGIIVPKNSHKDMRRLRQDVGDATIHCNKSWQSIYWMIDYLQMTPP